MQGTSHRQLPDRPGDPQTSGAGLSPRGSPDLLSADLETVSVRMPTGGRRTAPETPFPRNPRRLAPRARCTPRDERGSRLPVRRAALSAPRSVPDRHLRAEDGRVGAENRAYVPMRQCRSGRSGYSGRPLCWRTGGLARLRPDQSRLPLTVAIRASRGREADRCCNSPRTAKLLERGVAPGGRTLTSRPFWGGLDG
jgi:hypothetical protein